MNDSPPSPGAPDGARPERRSGLARPLPWVLSAALHLALFAWWASLPEPPRRVAPLDDLRAIELVELPPERQGDPLPSEPGLPSEPTANPANPATPDEPRAPTEPTSRGRRRPSDPGPSGPETPSEPTGPTEPAEPSSKGGVALSGLRGESRAASPTGSLRPTLAPPAVGHGRLNGRVGSQQPPPSVFADGKPSTFEEAGFRSRRNGKQVFRDSTGRFTATLLPDGRLKFRDMPVAISRDPITGAAKGLAMPGLAEGLRAASGIELYQQEKKRLLDATFELRMGLAISFAQDKLDRRLKSLYRELLDGWNDSTTSEVDRRAAVFRRWDECEEGLPIKLPGFSDAPSSELDDMRRTAGAQARETIERFVRRQLPAGSPQAYSAEELRTLNASRHSRARFAPYE